MSFQGEIGGQRIGGDCWGKLEGGSLLQQEKRTPIKSLLTVEFVGVLFFYEEPLVTYLSSLYCFARRFDWVIIAAW